MTRASRGRLSAAVLLTGATLLATPAAAHAIVVESTPAVDAVVTRDFDVRIRFNSRIDHKRSRVAILGADGGQLQVAQPPGDQAPDLLTGHVAGLGAGS